MLLKMDNPQTQQQSIQPPNTTTEYSAPNTTREYSIPKHDNRVFTLMKKYHGTAMVQPWYTTVNSGIPGTNGSTVVYNGTVVYMVQITCTMVDYGIPWYILTVPWNILVHPWFTELVPWCIMIYHGATLHNHSTIYLQHGMLWNMIVHFRTTMVQNSYTTAYYGLPWYILY